MKKSGAKEEEPASWLATFGDMATLLLTFYVMIYASCTYKPGQWETAQGAIEKMLAVLPGRSGTSLVSEGGHGMLPGQTSFVPLFGVIGTFTEAHWRAIEEAVAEAYDLMGPDVGDGLVQVEPTEEGIVFRVAEPIAFKVGEADLNPAIRPLLAALADGVGDRVEEIVVEGHTCDLPIHTARFASNWDLSGARAAEVVRFLVAHEVDAAVISARACGEYSPRVPNADEDSRRRNRRVEIRITFAEPVRLASEIPG